MVLKPRWVKPLLVLGLAVATALFVVWALRNLPVRFEPQIRAFESSDRDNGWPRNAVLFVGSSSVRKWPIRESFPEYRTIGRGFGGCFLSDVDYFAERIVFPYQPRAIVLYAGENDMDDGRSAQGVFEIYERFAMRVHEHLPKTRLLILPIKPTPDRWTLWPEMKKANDLIREYTQTQPLEDYVDTATPMLNDDGQPRAELYVQDGVHLSPSGYALWTNIVTQALGAPEPER